MLYSYKYPRPALSVDCVVFGLDDKETLKILLIQRRNSPFKDKWALPGGFMRMDKDESLEDAARRELHEEAGVENIFLEQLYTFGSKNRDPREWVASVAYYALVNLSEHSLRAATDASEAQWFSTTDLPDLAFDHQEIVDKAIERLRNKVRYQPIGFELLPKKFTFSQLQKLYESILGQKLDKRNFLRKFRSMDLLVDLNEVQGEVHHRPAKLYSFNEKKYEKLKEKGFNFEI
ncbi:MULTISPECIES: NUDIX domain-containing protein [Trichocoleus]|uniref:NUDIX hydrolase n=1 Tax=Trichocoleus desertorum GB2-A4 TaxID=2933944 RepID=A0ABV0JH09_9CYAN|nr:NUDIX domain-containing protein [Trichocoleus sp. FACHB-46]MBD1865112.1 NUDIX hydrolase [Trichocoleus sp. FACHB-46]